MAHNFTTTSPSGEDADVPPAPPYYPSSDDLPAAGRSKDDQPVEANSRPSEVVSTEVAAQPGDNHPDGSAEDDASSELNSSDVHVDAGFAIADLARKEDEAADIGEPDTTNETSPVSLEPGRNLEGDCPAIPDPVDHDDEADATGEHFETCVEAAGGPGSSVTVDDVPSGSSPPVEHRDTDPPDASHSGLISTVEAYIAGSLEFGADGDLRYRFAEASTPQAIAEVGALSPPSVNELVDDMVVAGVPYKPADLKRAVRVVGRRHAQARKKALIMRISEPLASLEERNMANAALSSFVEKVFEGLADVICCVLLHFVYQVKRKLARLPVSDHLMPIFVSKRQGVGKTRAVQRLLAPIEELAKSVRLTDIADTRSIFVFRHPVLVIDDMESIQRNQVANLKNRITDDAVRGRGMQSNHDVGTEQRATFIGTSNDSVSDSVPDPSGHRRFYELPFRNGNPADGGDPEIWSVVGSTDFLPIWRSVDPFEPSPIEPVREQVFGTSGPRPPKSKVHAWALTLDVESEAFRQIHEAAGVQSAMLCDLYCAQCQDAWMKPEEFGRQMREACTDTNVPLDWPRRRAKGVFFPLRRLPR